jgi:hypothetical protein
VGEGIVTAFTDDDVQAALNVTVNRNLCEHELALATNEKLVPSWVCEPCEMRAVLAAVAPAIAARALREGQAHHEREADKADSQTARTVHLVIADAYRTSADEIERTP